MVKNNQFLFRRFQFCHTPHLFTVITANNQEKFEMSTSESTLFKFPLIEQFPELLRRHPFLEARPDFIYRGLFPDEVDSLSDLSRVEN